MTFTVTYRNLDGASRGERDESNKTLPLRQGECPGGARGYDPVTRHTPPAYGRPLYLRGGVCNF